MKGRFKLFIVLLFASYLPMQLIAQDKIWTGAVDSSWHVAGNWSPSGVPSSTQTVGMRGNKKPYPVITSNVTIRSININQWYSSPGDQLTIRNNATLTITDDFTVNGAGVLNIVNGHVIMDATTSGSNNFAVNSATSVINITNGSFTAGTLVEDVDVEIIGTFNLGNGTLTVHGDFDISNSDTFNAEDGTVTINGNTTVNGTYNGDDGTTTFNGTVDVRSGGVLNLGDGTITFNGEAFVGNSGTANLGSGTVFINDNIEVKSGGYFNVEDADVTVTGDADFTSNGNLSIDSGSITITGNASLSSGGTMDLNSGSLNIGGDASFTSGGVVNAGDATLNLEGDFTVQNGSNFNADSSTVVFSGDSTQTVNSNGTVTFYNVVVDSGAVLNTDGGSQNTIVIENTLVVESGGGVNVEEDDEIDVQGGIEGGGTVQSPKPYVVSAVAPTVTSLVITFNRGMKESTAENLANYSIKRVSDGTSISISSATLNTGSDSTIVTLVISTILEDVMYKVTMNNIQSNTNKSISANHKNRFIKTAPVTFYSRQSGNWATNSTWSRVSHSGAAATSNPGNTNGATIIVGDGDVVTVASTTSITSQTSLEIKSGSKLILGTGAVFTTGTKTITGSGTFEVQNGTLQIGSLLGISSSGSTGNIQTTTRTFSTSGSYTYNGIGTQIVGNGLPSSVNNLTINNNSGVTISNNIEVTGTLTLTAGIFTINSGYNLIANTKSVSAGSLLMKHTITGSKGWRLYSTPISSTYTDFFDAIETQGFPGSSLGNAAIDSLSPNVLLYDETHEGTDNQRWRIPTNASNTIDKGKGLYTYVFGNIATDIRYNTSLPVDLTVQGQEHSGAVDFNVTYNTVADSGWNLIGNPYAATIDWDDAPNWTKTNIDNTIYMWDYATNQYKTWNGTTGDLGDGLISPFQGFWVKSNDVSPSLIVEEDAKTTGGTFVGKTTNEKKRGHPHFTISVSDDIQKSATHLMFSENASFGKDKKDGYRLLPPPGTFSFLDISTITKDNDRLSINNLPRDFGIPIEIPLFLGAYKNGYSTNKELHFLFEDIHNIPNGWEIYLIDSKTGAEINILENSTYLFSHESNRSKVSPNNTTNGKPKVTMKVSGKNQRFYIRIEPGIDGIDLPKEFKLEQNYPNPFNPSTNIMFTLPIQSNVTLDIYDLLGRKITTLVSDELSAGVHNYSWDASNLASGVYLYRLVTSDGYSIKKMTLLK